MFNSTWKDNLEPTPEDIAKLNTIENAINTLFESPTHGTRQQITNHEIIKAMISLIRDYKIQDRSHYNGYDSVIKKEALTHPKHKKTSLYFKGEQLFKNYVPLDCRLDDPEFNGMRINVCNKEIQILFDFYTEKDGYSKKCVIFDIVAKTPIVDREKEEKKATTSLAVHYLTSSKTKKRQKKQQTLSPQQQTFF